MWKLLVLVLFVWLGALAHIGAQALDVNYSDPMKVYDAGNILDWLSLRWLAVMKMHLPVAVVVASLWGAGNVPTSFRTLGTAILVGYSADSFTSALISRLGSTAPPLLRESAAERVSSRVRKRGLARRFRWRAASWPSTRLVPACSSLLLVV